MTGGVCCLQATGERRDDSCTGHQQGWLWYGQFGCSWAEWAEVGGEQYMAQATVAGRW